MTAEAAGADIPGFTAAGGNGFRGGFLLPFVLARRELRGGLKGFRVFLACLTLGVAATGSTDPVATFDIVTAAGLRAFAVAVGALAPDAGEEAFRLVVVNATASPWTATPVDPN